MKASSFYYKLGSRVHEESELTGMEEQQSPTVEKSETWSWIKSIGIALVLVFLARTFLFSAILVDGISMEPTLHDGDRMFVNKISYRLSEPKRQDIIVFHSPAGRDFVKRIIGVPGDTVRYENDQLFVNDEQVSEPYLDEFKAMDRVGSFTEDFELSQKIGSTTVPEGHLFVLGDNRRRSIDSRAIGVIPIEEVVGKTSLTFWPISSIGFPK